MAHLPSLVSESPSQIRVVTADSSRLNTQLLADSLAQDTHLQVAGVEPRSSAILNTVTAKRPHVLVISAALEESPAQGFHVARQVRTASPQTMVVVLLDSSNRSAVVEAFRCGARGVFCRTENWKMLARCIRAVYQGQVWARSSELHYLLEALNESAPLRCKDVVQRVVLSRREQDVVRCVAEGMSNREIAHRLDLTEHTVKNYMFRIFDKLGVSSRVEVVLFALGRRSEPPASPDSRGIRGGSGFRESIRTRDQVATELRL